MGQTRILRKTRAMGVSRELLGENRPRYIGSALYIELYLHWYGSSRRRQPGIRCIAPMVWIILTTFTSLQWHHNERDGVSIVCPTVCSGADKRKHQSSVSLAFMRGIHRWPVVSPHKGPVKRKMFPFDDVIMLSVIDDLTPIFNQFFAKFLE